MNSKSYKKVNYIKRVTCLIYFQNLKQILTIGASQQYNKSLSFSRKITVFPLLLLREQLIKKTISIFIQMVHIISYSSDAIFYLVQWLFYYFSEICKVAFVTYLSSPSSISSSGSAWLIIEFLSLEELKKMFWSTEGKKN